MHQMDEFHKASNRDEAVKSYYHFKQALEPFKW